MRHRICLIFSLVLGSFNGNCQDDERVVSIPVIFHVLYSAVNEKRYGVLPDSSHPGYVSKEKILAELKDLDDDFQALNAGYSKVIPAYMTKRGNPNIHFYVKDIMYFKVEDPSKLDRRNNTSTMHELSPIVDEQRYLNVYIGDVRASGKRPEGLTPVKEFAKASKGYDVVNLRPTSIGAHTHLLTHEVGHWLGLWHTFDSKQVNFTHITDIPLQKNSTDGDCVWCPPFKSNDEGSVPDNYQNFMDYSGCRSMFSKDQVLVMRNALMNYRPLIWNNKP